MFHRDTKSPKRILLLGLVATLAAISLLLVTTFGVLADTVNISDKANVLNTSQVQSAAANLPYPVNIYTMNNFTGTESAFNQEAVRTLTKANNPRLIIIAIDTHNKFLAIVGGKDVSTSNSVYNDAVNAFKSNFNDGDYTGATIAALQSLQSSLGGSTGSGNGTGISNTAAGFSLLPLCLVGLLVIGLIVVAGMLIMRSTRRRMPPYPMGNQYQQPYNQGYPPNYNQGYPPNYYGPGYNQQGPGMNPWAAGGIGAAAGGLIGYELGKHEGQEQGNVGSGDFGGGAGGTFGGNGGGDFGGGAGGDFGGAGGGDFGGGGGDFGGGGGSF
jgi:uncharacterized membrane protein YgcG